MPTAGELRPFLDRSTGELRVYVLLAVVHRRELWEDVGTGRQIWIRPEERAALEPGS